MTNSDSQGQSQGQSGFPGKAALTVVSVAAILSFWHLHVANPPGMEWQAVAEVARVSWLNGKAAHPVTGTAPALKVGTVNPSEATGTRHAQPPDALLIDNDGSLDHFYAALAWLDQHHGDRVATVVHFGDSPTTADLITGDVRKQLQQRFGDAGAGFNLIAKPWAWYQHRDIDETDRGWKFSTAIGVMREGGYGIGGVAADGGKGAFSRFKFQGTAGPDAIQIIWKTQPDGGSFTISADDRDIATVDTSKPEAPESEPSRPMDTKPDAPAGATRGLSAAAAGLQFRDFELPPGIASLKLSVEQGNVRIYGVLFERRHPGLVYDSIGLNGASVTVLSRALARDMMKTSFAHLHPDLIIINYGTNEAGFTSFIDKQYEGELRTAIARVREAAPTASLLLMSPMDRGERGAGNAIATMETIPKIVAIQRRVAAETGCGFFNTYQAMGGDGTMERWYDGRPRLVSGDLIHPTPQGAKLVADSFVGELEKGYSRYIARTAPNNVVAAATAP